MGPAVLDPEIHHKVGGRLDELYQRHRGPLGERVVQYYVPGRGSLAPHLVEERPETFGIAMVTLDGDSHGAGDYDMGFALQSVSKVFAHLLALEDHGREQVMERVGVEPSGDKFSSLVVDEQANRPYNPMVNAGALVTSDLIEGADVAERVERVVALMRRCAANDRLDVDPDTYDREMAGADRNRGTAYLLRSAGMLRGSAEDALAVYLAQCSVTATCRDLAVMGATLANGGLNPCSGERVGTRRHIRDVLSVMYTCGMYDFAGEWAYEVGVPAKSGVSGAILAPIPDKLGFAVFSPGLDDHGNSVRGVDVCRDVSDRLGLHVFATVEDDAVLGEAAT